MKLANGELARVALEKIEGYLLSDSHPVGRSKARFFRSVWIREGERPRLTTAYPG